jgi:hypothetical protein
MRSGGPEDIVAFAADYQHPAIAGSHDLLDRYGAFK